MPPLPQQTIYAIGDLHGRFDLLVEAIEIIDRHAAGRRRRLVFLGDYIDRGPQSRQVVEFLMALQRRGEVICLKGNHEAMMVRALKSPAGGEHLSHWLVNGGEATLHSYGAATLDGARDRAPASHVRWMDGLPLTTSDAHRIYVHAGLVPGAPLGEQTEETCLWIREAFLRAPGSSLPAHVVHGHTPRWRGKPEVAEPEILPHRTNLDTGAFATGVLSIGVFAPDQPGGPLDVLTARAAPEGAGLAPAARARVRNFAPEDFFRRT